MYHGKGPGGILANASALDVGVSDEEADFAFNLGDVSVPAGAAFSWTCRVKPGTLTLGTITLMARLEGCLPDDAALTDPGAPDFSQGPIPLGDGDTAEFLFGGWTGPTQGMPLKRLTWDRRRRGHWYQPEVGGTDSTSPNRSVAGPVLGLTPMVAPNRAPAVSNHAKANTTPASTSVVQ